ncbi:MAG: hypothetical protein LBQ32_11505 [Burkholderiaceae bacterium]|jgi:O-antigen/teichoic acid export membrane protein|nr:hypothetical protein [Burkholderiaceae bacterium]
MDSTQLTSLVSLILALSIASERLVEIIKGLIPFLSKKKSNPIFEGIRCSLLQTLAVASGVGTAYLARDYFPAGIANPTEKWSILGLGLLASGGSGLWNSILSYTNKIKDIEKIEPEATKQTGVM